MSRDYTGDQGMCWTAATSKLSFINYFLFFLKFSLTLFNSTQIEITDYKPRLVRSCRQLVVKNTEHRNNPKIYTHIRKHFSIRLVTS